MGNTKIPWAEKVWNPITGCTKISPGCRNCYAERMANRLRGRCGYPEDEPFRVTLRPDKLSEPWNWHKPQLVFVNSMSDLFHEDVPFEFISEVFAMMAVCQQHTFIVLTKRPQRMKRYFTEGCDGVGPYHSYIGKAVTRLGDQPNTKYRPIIWPMKNVWLGVTAENQEMADLRIPILLSIPATVRFVSVEPMLGSIDLTNVQFDKWTRMNVLEGCGITTRPGGMGQMLPNAFCEKLSWIIAGGESGPKARPMHPDWVRSLREQCQAAGVPYFFKQWGEWVHESQAPDILANYNPEFFFDRVNSKGFARVGKKIAGDLLDGKQYHEFPEVTK